MAKSYWQTVSTDSERSKAAALSWVSPLCDGMTVEKAEILCDIKTDREKKIKVIARDTDGTRFLATRTLGRKTYSVTRVRL
jgi:hypothetical protein